MIALFFRSFFESLKFISDIFFPLSFLIPNTSVKRIIFSAFIAYQSDFGKLVYSYVTDSKVELKKVSWPTKQETTQTTLGVIFVVIVVGILLWLFDMLLGWAIGTLYGVA